MEVSHVSARNPIQEGAVHAGRVARWALVLWVGALLLLGGGAFLVTTWVGRRDGGWFPEVLLLAVPAGLVLGAAVSVTLEASGRPRHTLAVGLGALVVVMATYAIAGAVSWWDFAQSGVSSPGLGSKHGRP